MLKLSCDVISDLLPLYYDDACTTDSRSLVEAHLKDCAACRSMLEKIHTEYRLDNMRQQHEETMLKNMVVFWNKSLLKSFLKGIYTASCILLLLSAVCVGLVRWPFVTVSPAAVLTNATVSGSEFVIHLKTTDGYKTISTDQLTTEDGKLFIFLNVESYRSKAVMEPAGEALIPLPACPCLTRGNQCGSPKYIMGHKITAVCYGNS